MRTNHHEFHHQVTATTKGFDVMIWVIVDWFTKSAYFLVICERSSAEKLAGIYVHKIVAQHGILVSITFDRDVQFTSHFWQKFHEEMGMRLHLSTTYHPHTNGQSERTI